MAFCLWPILSAGWPILWADDIGRRDRYYRPIYRYRSFTNQRGRVLTKSLLSSVMNSSMEHDEFTEGHLPNVELVNTPRVWMFAGMIDGIWILFPVAIFGTIVKGFLVSEEINVANFSETITLIQS